MTIHKNKVGVSLKLSNFKLCSLMSFPCILKQPLYNQRCWTATARDTLKDEECDGFPGKVHCGVNLVTKTRICRASREDVMMSRLAESWKCETWSEVRKQTRLLVVTAIEIWATLWTSSWTYVWIRCSEEQWNKSARWKLLPALWRTVTTCEVCFKHLMDVGNMLQSNGIRSFITRRPLPEKLAWRLVSEIRLFWSLDWD